MKLKNPTRKHTCSRGVDGATRSIHVPSTWLQTSVVILASEPCKFQPRRAKCAPLPQRLVAGCSHPHDRLQHGRLCEIMHSRRRSLSWQVFQGGTRLLRYRRVTRCLLSTLQFKMLSRCVSIFFCLKISSVSIFFCHRVFQHVWIKVDSHRGPV